MTALVRVTLGALLIAGTPGCGGDDDPSEPSPEVLLTVDPSLESIAVSGGRVYVSQRRDDGVGVYAVPTSGGDEVAIYASGDDRTIRIVGVDSESVFWIEWDGEDGVLRAADLDGGEVRLLAERAGLANAALDADYVYTTSDGSEAGQVRVDRLAKGGGSPETLGTVPAGVRGLLVDGADLVGLSAGSQTIWRLPTSGGDANVLATEIDFYTASSDVQTAAFGADEDYFYYYARLVDGITRVAKTTGEKQAIGSTGGGCADSLAVDGTDVYWTCDGGSVYRAGTSGGEAVTVVDDGASGGQLAIDATRLYWITPDQVMSLLR